MQYNISALVTITPKTYQKKLLTLLSKFTRDNNAMIWFPDIHKWILLHTCILLSDIHDNNFLKYIILGYGSLLIDLTKK